MVARRVSEEIIICNEKLLYKVIEISVLLVLAGTTLALVNVTSLIWFFVTKNGWSVSRHDCGQGLEA